MNPTITPAYGRDYKSKKEAVEAFEAGKDFVLKTHVRDTLINKEDLVREGIKAVNIRYKNMTMIAVVKV